MTSPKQRDSDNWLPPPPWEGLPPLFGAPWERQEEEEPRAPRRVAADRPQVKPPSTASTHLAGPGCKAADSCLLVHNYLVHLAEGRSGFGVLQIAKERLEEGATAASQLGRQDLAHKMREVASALPQVHTAEQAAALVPKLKDLCVQTWDLGRLCGDYLNPRRIEQARVLGPKVRTGEISRDQAKAELRQSNA
mgnify:CR=1 FL=1